MVTVWSRPSCSDSEFLARRLELDPELELRFSFEPSMSPRPETASCDDIGDNNQFNEEGNRDCLNENVLLTLFEDPLPPLLAILLLSAMLLLGLLPILLLTTLPTAGPMTLPPSLILPMATSVVIPVMAMVPPTMMAMMTATIVVAGFMITITMMAFTLVTSSSSTMVASSLLLAPPANLPLHLSTTTLLGLP